MESLKRNPILLSKSDYNGALEPEHTPEDTVFDLMTIFTNIKGFHELL